MARTIPILLAVILSQGIAATAPAEETTSKQDVARALSAAYPDFIVIDADSQLRWHDGRIQHLGARRAIQTVAADVEGSSLREQFFVMYSLGPWDDTSFRRMIRADFETQASSQPCMEPAGSEEASRRCAA